METEISFTDNIVKKCPYCGYEASLKHFGTWEKDGKRGLMGKDREGYIHLLCPECHEEIKYDSLSNRFMKSSDTSISGTVFNLIVLAVIGVVIYLLVKQC
ncbi:MAG: hypothetical protein AB1744_07445 [Candidatus Zixiibacteriota bacterium]